MFLVKSQYLLLSENAIILGYIYYLCIPGYVRASCLHNGERSVLSRQSDRSFAFWRKNISNYFNLSITFDIWTDMLVYITIKSAEKIVYTYEIRIE